MKKKIQIIGGNSDIGYCVAKKFAEDGNNIQLVSKNFEALNKKKFEIENLFNVECEVVQLDIEDENQVDDFLQNNKNEISVIIIAVGYLEKKEINFDKIINLNYKSLVSYIEKKVFKFNTNGLQTIIAISSIAGDRGKKNNNIYSSSKAGFSNYLEGLRQKLYSKNINVMIVKPGFVRTKMTQGLNLPEFLVSSAEKIGNIIYRSYKNKKNVVYAPLYWKYIMIIYRLLPEFLFKLLIKFRK